MAGVEGKLVLGRCTAGLKAATRDDTSTKPTLTGCTAHHRSATEPMEVSREHGLLKRKAEEEIYPDPDQEQEKAMAVLMPANLHKGPDVVSVAAAGEATEPKAEGGIQEAVLEPDVYEDEAEDDYQDDAEYDDDYDYDDEEEDYDYDYESQIEEQRPQVRAMLQSFPEAANLKPQELDDAVERVLEQSKPEYENMAAPGKIRLLQEDIEIALEQWTPPSPSVVNNWCPNHTPSADSIRMDEELDKEFLPLYGKSDEDREQEQFRAKVRKDLLDKGYVEVDEDYYDKKDEYERQMVEMIQEEWDQKMRFSRSRAFANNKSCC